MMRRSTAWAATLALALSGIRVAVAADLPPAAPEYKAPPAPPPYNWTGFYVGANAGYGWGRPSNTITGDVDEGAGASVLDTLFLPNVDTIQNNVFALSEKTSGALGGLQAGFNWQPDPRWLLGIETDFQFSGMKGSSNVSEPPNIGVFYSLSSSQKLDWFGTLRARLGLLLTDHLLLFGSAGLAYGETNARSSITAGGTGIDIPPGAPTTLLCNPGNACFAASQSRDSVGWAAGAGIEYAAWQNVSLKLEYLHVALDSQTLTLVVPPPSTGTGFVVQHFGTGFDTVRAGASYHF